MLMPCRLFKNLSNKTVFIFLFGYTFLIRFPFFFRDYIDRDESTFILMGQSWVDGHLPYTELWDIKPPLIFFFFGSIIYVFGKSFIAIRLIGVLLVTVSSFFTYKIAENLYSRVIALGVALLSVALQSLFGSIQGVMSEHLVIAFFMPALWLLLKNKNSTLQQLLTGIFIGAALMVKLNMAYAVLFIGFFIIGQGVYHKNIGIVLKKGIVIGIGATTVVALCFLPYYFKGLQNLWWQSVIEAPLAYAGARTYHPIKMVPYILPVLLFLFWGWKKKFLSLANSSVLLLVLVVLGVLWSFVKSGRVNSHYLILLHPILLILVGFAINEYKNPLKKVRICVWPILLFLLPIESYLEYANIVQNKIQKGRYFNGEGIDVPNYLLANKLNTKNILFFEYHIGYWVLDKKPPAKSATQPSNILKDEMFFAYNNPRKTGMEELYYLMEDLQPPIIITRKNRQVFDKKMEDANTYINNYLQRNYSKLDSVDGAMVYQRLE